MHQVERDGNARLPSMAGPGWTWLVLLKGQKAPRQRPQRKKKNVYGGEGLVLEELCLLFDASINARERPMARSMVQ
jgi:hypothetical protein